MFCFVLFCFNVRCLDKDFCPNRGNLNVRVCLRAEAGFGPCGPEPSRGYVTETSHPDVELVKVYAGAAQRSDGRAARGSFCFFASLELCVLQSPASGLAAEPHICLSAK